MIAKRPRKKVRIAEANNKCVQLTTKTKGFIYNVYDYDDAVSFQLLKFPSGKRVAKQVTANYQVGMLFEEEMEEILNKFGDRIIQQVPHSGCSLGTDPEVFVVDEKDTIIPAFEFLPDKSKSIPMSFRYGGGIPFWDGFQAEFTTDISRSLNASCLAFTIDDVRNGLREVLRAAKKYNPKARLTWRSVLDIPNHIMDKADPIHRELGCMPSKNVYPHIKPIQVDSPSALPFRFAGCHLHFGFPSSDKEATERIVKTIDAIWGVTSVSLLRGMEDKRRRAFYGRAGEYRDPEHGVEYRTTSSAVLAHPVLLHMAFDIARAAAYIAQHGLSNIWRADEDDIIRCINEYDVSKAELIIRENKTTLIGILEHIYPHNMVPKLLDMIIGGALSYPHFRGLKNMSAAWKLDTYWSSHASTKGCSVYNAPGSNYLGEDRGYDVGDPGGINEDGEVLPPLDEGQG